MSNLLPCPFCGAPAVSVAGEYITCGGGWSPMCAGHMVKTSPVLWNTRSSGWRDEATEALEKAHRVVDWYAFDWHEYDEGSRARGVLPVIESALTKLKSLPSNQSGEI